MNDKEDQGRKKNIAFKTEVVKGNKQKGEEDSDDDENLSLMIKKFTKFMKDKCINQFKSRRIKDPPQTLNSRDVEKLVM